MRKLTVGLLAHVDAGKTTLSEALLYRGGALRTLGRVDHADAFLDHDSLERERGITIFLKQAVLPLPDVELTLLDTPATWTLPPRQSAPSRSWTAPFWWSPAPTAPRATLSPSGGF